MPFTLSHAAAVLPLAKPAFRVLPFSALAIGSMSPDFPYFFLTRTDFSGFGHWPLGVFVFDVPFGLLVYFAFHHYLKLPLIALLPCGHQERYAPVARHWQPPQNAKEWICLFFALFIGALTHLIWDDFTHYNGWSVEQWTFLATPVFQMPASVSKRGEFVRVYKVLQYVSTFFGLAVLLLTEKRWRNGLLPVGELLVPAVSTNEKLRLAATMVLGGSTLGLFCIWFSKQLPTETVTINSIIHDGIVGAITGSLLVVVIWCWGWLRARSRQSP